MKNMRIPLLIALGVAVIGIILGSFLDLQISSAIASPKNYFGLAVSAFAPTVAFATVAAMGGGFIAFIIKGKYHIGLKILFGVLAAACLGVSIKFPAGEWFGINGFYEMGVPEWAGYLVVIVPECAAMVGGYFLFKDWQNENLWIVFCIIIVVLCIVLLGVVTGLKGIMHRPRYRFISSVDVTLFHNWWEPCKNYKELIEQFHTSSDNFKSYPSGHTAETAILLVMMTFLPLAHEKFKKWQMPLFYASCGFLLLLMLSRILAAAHFLSDVSFGAFSMIVFLYIANEVVMRIKPLQLKEEAPEEEKEKAE